MSDYIELYEKSINRKATWKLTLIKIAVAIVLIIWVYYSVLPIQAQVRYYNTFLQVGTCLCPSNSTYNDYFNLRNITVK